jgi:hypothetical protein
MKLEFNFVRPGIFDLPKICQWGFEKEEVLVYLNQRRKDEFDL